MPSWSSLLLLLLPLASLHGQPTGDLQGFALGKHYEERSDSLAELPDYPAALRMREKAMAIYEQLPGQERIEGLASCYSRMGVIQRRLGNWEKAAALYRAGLSLAETHLDSNHIILQNLLNDAGVYYLLKGEFSRSMEFLERALAIALRTKSRRIASIHINMGIIAEQSGRFTEALDHYRLAMRHNRAHPDIGFWHRETATSYLNAGSASFNADRYPEALSYFDTCLIIYDSILPPDHPEIAALLNNMGVVHNFRGDYRNALHFLKSSLQVHLGQPGGNTADETAAMYSNIGLLLMESGDFHKALPYFRQALDIRENLLGENHPDVARGCNYIGDCYLQMNQFANALPWLNKALQIQQNLQPGGKPADRSDCLSDLGTYHEKTGNYPQAISFYRRALAVHQDRPDGSTVDVAGIRTRLGRTYWRQGLPDLAIPQLEASLRSYRTAFGPHHKEIARTLLVLANANLPDTSRALRFCHEAMVALHYDTAHPTDFSRVWAPVILLEALTLDGRLRSDRGFRQGRLPALLDADRRLRAGLSLVDHILASLEGPGSRQYLTDNYFKLFETAILNKFRLQTLTGNPTHWQEAFHISERSNAALLLEAVRMADITRFSDIPDSLVRHERQLAIDLSFYLRQLSEAGTADRDGSPTTQALHDHIFRTQEAYSALVERLRERYPAYYRLRHITDLATVGKVQTDILSEGQAMVAYFSGEQHLFAFVIEPGAFHAVELPIPASLSADVMDIQHSILAFDPLAPDAVDMAARYARQAHRLYRLLLEPLVPLLSSQNLILLPGGVLGYLPFEALLTKPAAHPEDIGSYDFVIRSWQVSYAYSATLLDELKKRPALRPFQHKMAAFAPAYDGRADAPDAFAPLRFNQSEAAAASRLFGGSLFAGTSATLANFRSSAPHATMLHLAAHGKSDDLAGENSFVAFYPDGSDPSGQDHLLFARDLYGMRIKAALVVLSACETGSGHLQRGEGIISLARGFFYAGASCLVTTLWRIDDVASQSLMQAFYQHLRKGNPVDGALRQAKLDFLRDEGRSLRAHPLFWAAYVPSGNTAAVDAGRQGPWLWFAAFLLAAFLIWRRYTPRPPRHAPD